MGNTVSLHLPVNMVFSMVKEGSVPSCVQFHGNFNVTNDRKIWEALVVLEQPNTASAGSLPHLLQGAAATVHQNYSCSHLGYHTLSHNNQANLGQTYHAQ